MVTLVACLGLTALAVPVTLGALEGSEARPGAAGLAAEQAVHHDGPVVDLTDAFESLDDAPLGVSGEQALAMLGGEGSADLAAVAAAHRMTPTYLAETLAADDSLHLAADGRLFYVDSFDGLADADGHGHSEPVPAGADAPSSRADASSGTPLVSTDGPEFPLADTFKLHSRPGSPRTIYLDLDGHTFTDADGWHTGLTFCGWFGNVGQAAFTAKQRKEVQDLWRRVASHYEAFDVDVTTEDPGREALRWDGTSQDVHFGHRAVVSGDRGLIPPNTRAPCVTENQGGTVGLAYIDQFRTKTNGASLNLGQATGAAVAWIVNHEVGHSVGLNHTFDVGLLHNDPSRTMSYAAGGSATFSLEERRHASFWFWRPGPTGTQSNSWQFLPSIRNTRDEAEPIRVGEPVEATLNLPDQPGPTARTSGTYPLKPTVGDVPIPASAPDEDWYSVGECATVLATARPLSRNSHLNLKLSLRDASGTEIGLDAPTDSTSATLSGEVAAPGDLYLVVSGSSPAEGGVEPADLRVASARPGSHSSGTYALDLVTCGDATPAPTRVHADTAPDGTIAVTWEAPRIFGATAQAADGLEGFEIALDGRRTVTVDAAAHSHVFPATPDGVSVRIRSRSAVGASVWTEPVVVGTAPIAPLEVRVVSTAGGAEATITHDPRWLAQAGAWDPASMPMVQLWFVNAQDGKSFYFHLPAVQRSFQFSGDYQPAAGSTADVVVVRDGHPSARTSYTYRGPTASTTVPLVAPSDLRLVSTTTSTRLHWTVPDGKWATPLAGYTVRSGSEVLDVEDDATSVTLPDRILAEAAPIILTARTQGGEEASATVVVPVDSLPGEPTGVEIREGATGTSLVWDRYTQQPVTGALTGWHVTIGGRAVEVPASAGGLNLTGFRGDRTLRVTLQPVNAAGVGPARTVTLDPAG
ncbi:zinc-dependent metalloprotease family protein [Nocardioides yefusunii]|uniref:zinc-dependent metalloprotease family protein n=1 Tax=Nocardioides yefusunii TaxID=2500546 RepID=UPI000FE430A6|nr:zinc-dependent metalloprotease family protein [Nocardioides yefusunii]